MARYGKVGVNVWSDEKFLQLSQPPPSGRYLWLFLLAPPMRTSLPGFLAVGKATLAEEIGWPVRALERCWNEIAALKMGRADWDKRLVWLPNAIYYDPPLSPNVAHAWGKAFDAAPECALKEESQVFIESFLKALRVDSPEAFLEAFRKPLRKNMRIPVPVPVPTLSVSGSHPSPKPSPPPPEPDGVDDEEPSGTTGAAAMEEPGEPLWPEVKKRLHDELDGREFKTWFQPTRQRSFDGAILRVVTPNKVFADWLGTRHAATAGRVASEIHGSPVTVAFEFEKSA